MIGGVQGAGGFQPPSSTSKADEKSKTEFKDLQKRLEAKRDLAKRSQAKIEADHARFEEAEESHAQGAAAEARSFEAQIRERLEGKKKGLDGKDGEGAPGKDGEVGKEGLDTQGFEALFGKDAGAKALDPGKQALMAKDLGSKETARELQSKEATEKGRETEAKAAKTEKTEKGERTEAREGERKIEARLEKEHARVEGKRGRGDDSLGGEGGGKKEDVTKDDLQAEIAKHMLPGQGVHPFMLQQVEKLQAPEQVEKPQIPPEVVDKIVESARFGLNAEGAHEFHIDLKADVFKGLKLKVTTKDGKVGIQMIADNPEVQRAFEARADDLAKLLAAKGLNVQTVNVSVGEGRSGGGAGGGERDRSVGGAGGAKRAGARSAAGGDEGSGLGKTGVWVDRGPKTGKDYSA
jgi:hypothetical protein